MGSSPNPDQYEFARCSSCVSETKKQLLEADKRINEKHAIPKPPTLIQQMERQRTIHGGKMAMNYKQLLGR